MRKKSKQTLSQIALGKFLWEITVPAPIKLLVTVVFMYSHSDARKSALDKQQGIGNDMPYVVWQSFWLGFVEVF